ncbi:coiled-coil domain-containing protein 106-like [Danio aesculapii]|uniref:coiled-coil domain-containing protein 106-like n=1 Tax=Danio aesculapii TaxID=1142201 RepID=UPI0024C05C1A|nr:coiled-coil domain-containing protein 106-like [Danio aesculapii]
MENIHVKNKEKPADMPKRTKHSLEDSESASADSSESSDSESSSSDSSRERKKKKVKKGKKRVKKMKKSKHESKFFPRVTEPWQVVKRYKAVLEIFDRGSNMTFAFRKYGVDRNTIVQTAVIAELAIAAPEKNSEIQNNRGEKLSSITQKCQDAIMADESIAHKIQAMKKEGKLFPIRK